MASAIRGPLLAIMPAATFAVAALAASSGAAPTPPYCRGVPATITAASGTSAVIKGSRGDDVIVANGTENLVLAHGGNDLVCGKGRDDLIVGESGDDALAGQGANDILLGDAGEDLLKGGIGDDHLNGGRGVDRCRGGPGRVAFSGRTCEQHPGPRLRGLRRLYYLGNAFGAHRLSAFGVWLAPTRKLPWVVVLYGHPHGTWPVDVQNWSVCDRYPAAYPSRLSVFPFRGAKAAWNPYAESLEIYTRRVAIVIFGDDPALVEAAGHAVRPVTGARLSRLQPPVEGSLSGHLPCQ